MSIRVTSSTDKGQTVLRIDGRLMSEDVAEVASQCETAQTAYTVDLSDLQSADSEGVRLLLELVRRGAQIRGASPYIELLLKREN
jgi:ABC-type transporter Mla MlaB component